MPTLKNRLPFYRLHRASGQAIVTLSGEDRYLGPHNTDTSRRNYEREISEWVARGRVASQAADALATVNMVLAAYLRHAIETYGGGESRGEVDCIRGMMRPLKRLYGATLASTFGPLALHTVREAYISLGWSRSYVNAQVKRLRRMFKWAVSRELVAAGVWQSLTSVEGLKVGRTTARETSPVRPVDASRVEATLEHLSPTARAMVRLQLVTGMRPGEMVRIRACDIDMTGYLWVYSPPKHKTQHHGHPRAITLGPKARTIIEPFLVPDLQAYLFSPQRADAELRAMRRDARVTPLSCGNRAGTNVKTAARRKPGARYSVGAYAAAITRACERAFSPPATLQRLSVKGARGKRAETAAEWRARLGDKRWAELQEWRSRHAWHPNQLRHTAATALRKQFGLEAAQVILGHATISVTEIYAEKNVTRAKEIMAEIG